MEIEAFDADTVEELRTRARNAMLTEAIVREEHLDKVDKDLLELEGMDPDLAARLSAAGVCTRDDLGELAVGELRAVMALPAARARALIDAGMEGATEDEEAAMQATNEATAKELIMAARAHWFEPQS